jgi:hypothetical protein
MNVNGEAFGVGHRMFPAIFPILPGEHTDETLLVRASDVTGDAGV